jgi:hypothetical protein
MRRSPKIRVAAICCLVAGLNTVVAFASSDPVVSPTVTVEGRSYTQWIVASVKWEAAHLRVYDGKAPANIPCVTAGQRGKVWILSWSEWSLEVKPRRITCHIPSGDYVLFAGPGLQCALSPHGICPSSTRAALTKQLRKQYKALKPERSLELDGERLAAPGPVVLTPIFEVHMPRTKNWFFMPGRTRALVQAEEQSTLLRPLSPGEHTLISRFHSTHEAGTTTIVLTVG